MSLPPRLALCFVLFLPALPIPAQAGQQEDLEQLRTRISALQREMEKTGDSRTETADALRESERAISTSNRKLHNLNLQQRNANQELARMQQQARNVSADMQAQQVQLARLLQQQYLGGQQEYFKLLLSNQDPNQVARDLQYYDYIARSRAAWLKQMRGNLARLQEATAQIQQKTAELDALKAEQTRQRQALLQEKERHQQVLRTIAVQLKQQRREMGRLQHDENRLGKLVENLSHIIKSPAPAAPVPNKPRQALNSNVPGFVSMKGKLPLPVAGKISNRFGSRRPDSPVLWKGLFLKAAAGQQVTAIAAGRVIYADWLRGFGNLLIIDHGADYMSLYGNNEALYKQVGDTLDAGEAIAAVGNSGGNENYGLYFELRHEGIPLDPEKWIKGRLARTR